MRISDWSSDVCPSDLGGIGVSKDPTQVSCASIRTDANVTDFQLPSPDADALAHSARLDALIDAQIDAADGAAIPFSRFMELALYAPGLGYYSAGASKFGEAGDFVTAPELGPVFAACVDESLPPVLPQIGPPARKLEPGRSEERRGGK